MEVCSSQFKTALIRRLRNLISSCRAEFVNGVDKGIGFRLLDEQRRYRSNIVRIYRYSENTLNRKQLLRNIVSAGVPTEGLRKEL